MDIALVTSGLLLGLAGTPHCTAMCGAACGALARRCEPARPHRALAALHLGRVASYAVGGAIAASSVGLLRALGDAAPVLRPLWLLLHLAALALGLWLLATGRQPGWLRSLGRPPALPRVRRLGALRAGAAGTLWIALPCGLLQSALVVAALASSASSGAAVMAAFALASSFGLVAGPALWWRLTGGSAALAQQAPAWALRLSGLALAAAAGWALGHGMWQRVLDYCFA